MDMGIAFVAALVAIGALLPPEESAMATVGYMVLISSAMTAGVTMSILSRGRNACASFDGNLTAWLSKVLCSFRNS